MTKKLVGYVGVDSGQVLICDPCYLGKDSQWQEDDEKETFQSVPEGKFSYMGCGKATLSKEGHGQLVFKLGHAGAGVVSGTYDGDGIYPVYAHYKKGESRPFKLEIIFN